MTNKCNLCGEPMDVVGKARGIDLKSIDPEAADIVAKQFDIAEPLAREIVFINDEGGWGHDETPEVRWHRVRNWSEQQLRKESK